jgi:hypothetical protein
MPLLAPTLLREMGVCNRLATHPIIIHNSGSEADPARAEEVQKMRSERKLDKRAKRQVGVYISVRMCVLTCALQLLMI